MKALNKIWLDAKRRGFVTVDSKVSYPTGGDILNKKLFGTLKMNKGRHPNMDYLDE